MITVVEGEFEYGRVFTPPEQELLAKATESFLKFSVKGDLEYGSRSMIIPLDTALSFGEFTVKRVVTGGIGSKLERIIDQLSKFVPHETSVVNEKCHVAVAGLGTLSINEVVVEQDYCTQDLQKALDAGWRILAVMVQPDQRRPDYILGRTVNKPTP